MILNNISPFVYKYIRVYFKSKRKQSIAILNVRDDFPILTQLNINAETNRTTLFLTHDLNINIKLLAHVCTGDLSLL